MLKFIQTSLHLHGSAVVTQSIPTKSRNAAPPLWLWAVHGTGGKGPGQAFCRLSSFLVTSETRRFFHDRDEPQELVTISSLPEKRTICRRHRALSLSKLHYRPLCIHRLVLFTLLRRSLPLYRCKVAGSVVGAYSFMMPLVSEVGKLQMHST